MSLGDVSPSRYIPDFIPKFLNQETERNFREFNEKQYEVLLRTTWLFYIFIQLLLILTEYFNDNLYNSALIIVLCRVGIIFIVLFGWLFTTEHFLIYRRFVILLTLHLVSFMLLLLYTLVSFEYSRHHTLHDSRYFYCWGPWSLSDSYLFLILCFNSSGLLFADATTTSFVHILLVSVFPFIFFLHHDTSSIHSPLRLLCLPVLHAIEMIYIQKIEFENRDRYIGQIERGQLLLCQDRLISSILPPEISEALKSSETKSENHLAAYYENVTILFCYIVDFSSHSSMIHPHDTIQLSLQVVSVFDRIVEQTGAYKVENIGDTYMACAGCPTETSDHSFIICRTAIAMIKAAERSSWRWPDGSPVTIKIGIHTGAVTAGIVGTKSYSYHLFGDAVNTASRMCSCSSPGKISLSPSAEETMRLNHPGIFISRERGEVDVKGKGSMILHWLEGFHSAHSQYMLRRSKTVASSSKYLEHLGSMKHIDSPNVTVNPWRLRFCRPFPEFGKNAPIHPTLKSSLNKKTNSSVDRDPPSDHTLVNEGESAPFSTQDTIRENEGYQEGMSSVRWTSEKGSSLASNLAKISSKEQITSKEVSSIERRFKETYAEKNLLRQCNMLGLLVIYYLLIFLYAVAKNEPYLLRLYPLLLLTIVRISARRWSRFPKHAQHIIVLSSILLSAYTRYLASTNHHYKSPSTAILYILFTSLFLRLRFHYVLLYLVLLLVSAFLVSHFVRKNEHQSYIEMAYRVSSLIICGIVIYSHEYILRTEFIDVYLLNKKLEKSEEILSNMLPSREHARKLLYGELVREDHEEVSILYSDIKGFTPLASELHPLRLCQLLNRIYTAFDEYLSPFGLYKVDTIGDAFVVVGGMTGPEKTNHAMNSIFFAFYMLECIRKIRERYGFNLQIRVGIHTGSCTGAVVSANKPRYLVWGPSSITANHLESSGVPNCVHISREAYKRLDMATLNRYGIVCQLNENSESDKTYLLTCTGTELFGTEIDPESQVEQRSSGSIFSLALSRLKRISVGKRNEGKSPHSPKVDRLPINIFTSPLRQDSSLSNRQSPSSGRSGNFFSSTARSYDPIAVFEKDNEGYDFINTKPLKLSTNPEPATLALSLNELHDNTPHLELPQGWQI